MRILILGGTRNIGYLLTHALVKAGHDVNVLTRGKTGRKLPDGVTHFKADRTVPTQLEAVLAGQRFDAVIDFIVFNGDEAKSAVNLFHDKTDHYIFISTGQVYLVRTTADGIPFYTLEAEVGPFSESDYDGPVMPEPAPNTYDHAEWAYGFHKREAEDVFARAHAERNFPYTALRLSMVNSAYDPLMRLYSYFVRMADGGPLLLPDDLGHPLRHVSADDAVRVIELLLASGPTAHRAFNIAGEPLGVWLDDMLRKVGQSHYGAAPQLVRVPRAELMANGFLPDCSPFSELWMSHLDNQLSVDVLGMSYTSTGIVIDDIHAHYTAHPPKPPSGYRRREAEIAFAKARITG